MNQIFGEFIDKFPAEEREFLRIGFSPSSTPIQQRWRNNGLSADFVANYLSTFFPVSDDVPSSRRRQLEVKSAVSYIANELLENAMKYNYEPSRCPIKLSLDLVLEDNARVVISIANSISPEQVTIFQEYIQHFLSVDAEEFYLSQLERNAESGEDKTSGLGLITMKNDYEAKLGWKFERLLANPETIVVTTMVQLVV